MKKNPLALGWVVLLGGALIGCGGAPDAECTDSAVPGSYNYNFQLTSSVGSLNLGNATYVSVPRGCSDGVVSQDHSVPLSGSPATMNFGPIVRSTTFLFSIYIDVNTNSVLDSGDLVWGTDPTAAFGVIVTPNGNFADTVTKDWDAYGTAQTGGTRTYTGATQTW